MIQLLLYSFLTVFQVSALSPEFVIKMRETSWHLGCPVSPSDLRMLTLSYWDFNNRERMGQLVVNSALADEVASIFRRLYAFKFPIERMQPVEEYGANDDLSMAANNTSAYNCRDITGQPGKFSNHSWGRAIDLNPLTNPYVKGAKVLPEAGRVYLDREKLYKGGIVGGGVVVETFKSYGWTWGGDWPDRKDYQHFEKPLR